MASARDGNRRASFASCRELPTDAACAESLCKFLEELVNEDGVAAARRLLREFAVTCIAVCGLLHSGVESGCNECNSGKIRSLSTIFLCRSAVSLQLR